MTHRLKVVLALAAGYSALTIAITAPLAWHLGSRVPHDVGDPLLSTLILWWNAHYRPLSAAWWDGWFFSPATGALALSDHRLGESLLASPLQWLGASSLAAYNVTLLATFPLCALAAHWLAFTLTKRHDASLVAGLAYGFSPYRFAHIEHLELLAAFGMPAALAALHAYLEDRRPIWFVAFGGALLLQALCCSYYFLFFSVMLSLWMLWFVRRRDWRLLAGVAIAGVLVLCAISPIALKYFEIHRHYGLARGIGDIVDLSADVTSVVTASPLSAIWGWTAHLNGAEKQLFPGATILAIVAIAGIASLATRRSSERSNQISMVLIAIGLVFALIAFSAWRLGPWKLGRLSVGAPFKPFSLAFFAWIAALLCWSRVRDAYARESSFAFYVLATAALFLFSLGPKPGFLHQQFLYQPPYSWLMRISLFGDGIRAPARFGMLAILALSTAAALACARLTRSTRRPSAIVAIVAAVVIADSWISGLPLPELPPRWDADVAAMGASVAMELPVRDPMRDIAAMYRASLAGITTANGNSGYEPPHYRPMSLALALGDETVFDALGESKPVLVVVERPAPGSNERIAWLRSAVHATEVQSTDRFAFFLVRSRPIDPVACSPAALPIASARDIWGPLPLGPLVDGRLNTFWSSGDAQQTGDILALDMGRDVEACGVRLSLGTRAAFYPNALSVATSTDGTTWHTTFNGKLGGQVMRAALAHPLDIALDLPLDRQPARYIRMRIEADQPRVPWEVMEVRVLAASAQ
ncbi:MAG TPA: discoidin domain-containing protein [Vicinamibacterales bacterium]|jgi:hypothetical protein